ncbi:hypothetical protein [Bifidobacterium vansinderenii]|uniref:Uncharacterized protein n=1 Tax=Bifidobacterium vansinderenii TaxID=1984871 RepID=A0A229VY12_9BIFI|nr:hypothetical protein [Bifidobacterium vansinderenii]OXN00436.1 hypothetical protein Tam10B_1306 [Bifidobacterium vansinderenii]
MPVGGVAPVVAGPGRLISGFADERSGQIAFYGLFLGSVDSGLTVDDVLRDNTDGVVRGNLLEFKLSIPDLNVVVSQCVKYLSAERLKGRPVPANIILIDLIAEVAYVYGSKRYMELVERVYSGAASKNNDGFVAGPFRERLDYGSSDLDRQRLIDVMRTNDYERIHLDANCIVGWGREYYRLNPAARKDAFLGDEGEIRNPDTFRDYIYPYEGPTNVEFQYLMDKLNDDLSKKNLGAFYTPKCYADKSLELLREAIKRVPEGNDYVIIDRCAGTGNLEKGMTDEELSHCVLSTIEFYEYKVLVELLGARTRAIIPPVASRSVFVAGGNVRGANAMSRSYLENEVVMRYVRDPKCTIIMYENPPFSEATSVDHQSKGKSGTATWRNDYVVKEMKKAISGTDISIQAAQDLGNSFIWSAFHYYLRQPTDSYVVYSPVKYWKAQNLISKRFIDGYGFNRRWFHTNIDACIMVALWSNEDSDMDGFTINGYDYDERNDCLKPAVPLEVKRLHSRVTDYYDKRPIPEADRRGVLAGLNGYETTSRKPSGKPAKGEDLLGYMAVYGAGFDNPELHSSLLTAGRYDGHGFYLHRDNYLEKLPLFCASRFISYNRGWTERGLIMKSADGKDQFERDVRSGKLDQWLLKCLLFTCLERQNHMVTFTGSDGEEYRNELTLDTTNGPTIAATDIARLQTGPDEAALLLQWDQLLEAAKATREYDPAITYGVYQIGTEIDTSRKDPITGKTIYNNVPVHSAMKALKPLLRDYYNTEIAPVLRKYEYIK